MNITSFSFILFCIIVMVIYYIVPKKFQWVILLISSLFFIGQLAYLKYTNFLLITLNHIFNLLDIEYCFDLVNRTSLIGISYYSLIMIGYLIDIYRGTCKAQKNIFKCALFMSYFPILSSGPFIRYNEISENLYGKHKLDYKKVCNGSLRILWGAFKISSRLGFYVDTVYENLNIYQGFYVIIAVLFFTLQLYTNFSGSIDVIMGISEIFGIALPENFNLPFFSKTITEFWRNWHITLGAWLRDYIFYPLLKSKFMQWLMRVCKERFGKKVGKKIPLYISMLIMWILIGLWHGGTYTYIIGSGLLQFLFIFFEDVLAGSVKKINKKIGINTEVFSYKLYQTIRTFLLFSFSMIFFRANSIMKAFKIIKSMFVWNPGILTDVDLICKAGIGIRDLEILCVSLVILFIVEMLMRKNNVRDMLFKQNIIFRWGILYILIFSIIIFGCYGPDYDATAFIYQNF